MTGGPDAVPALPAEVANLARRIHHSALSRRGGAVIPLATVMHRLRRAGHQVTAEQVRQAILRPPAVLAEHNQAPP